MHPERINPDRHASVCSDDVSHHPGKRDRSSQGICTFPPNLMSLNWLPTQSTQGCRMNGLTGIAFRKRMDLFDSLHQWYPPSLALEKGRMRMGQDTMKGHIPWHHCRPISPWLIMWADGAPFFSLRW